MLTVLALLATTIVHGFVLRNLFPNDISIAITERKVKPIVELHEMLGSNDSAAGRSNDDIEAGVATVESS